MTGNKEVKQNIQKIWDRDNYINAFHRTLYTEDLEGIKSYLNFLTPEKWDKGFLGANLLYDIIYRQNVDIVRLVLNKMNEEQKNDIYTKSFVNDFLEHLIFIPNRGGNREEAHSYRPMNPELTELILNNVMEHNSESITLKSINRAINKIQEVMVKKNYPSISNFVSNDSINLNIMLEMKNRLEKTLTLKEESEIIDILPNNVIKSFSLHNQLALNEKEKIQNILDIIENQHTLHNIMTHYLPELINDFAPIPHNIQGYDVAKNSFNASLNEIHEQINSIYSQAFQANIDKIQVKEQFLNSKKMNNSL